MILAFQIFCQDNYKNSTSVASYLRSFILFYERCTGTVLLCLKQSHSVHQLQSSVSCSAWSWCGVPTVFY